MAKAEQVAPADLRSAKSEYEEQLEVMQDIHAQLGDLNKSDRDGRRLTHNEYWDWRQKAKIKLRYVVSRVRFLKEWIRENQQTNEKGELKIAVAEYAVHHDTCLWWEGNPCCCGLNAILDKYGLDRLDREEFDEGPQANTEVAHAAG